MVAQQTGDIDAPSAWCTMKAAGGLGSVNWLIVTDFAIVRQRPGTANGSGAGLLAQVETSSRPSIDIIVGVMAYML